jgi:hypothetical protein
MDDESTMGIPTPNVDTWSESVVITQGVLESTYDDTVILSPAAGRSVRRLVYVDNYGGRGVWEKIKKGEMPSQHLRGCLQLVRQGYEIALSEPLPDFYLWRRPLPHDLKLLKLVRWAGKDGIIFCGHNVLYWLLILKKLAIIKCSVVSHVWAREPLDFARAHSGIIALTAAGAEHARMLAPNVTTAHLGWGADLSIYPRMLYDPQMFFSCGIAGRDFMTLSLAATSWGGPVTVFTSGRTPNLEWSSNVDVVDSGKGWNFEAKRISYRQLLEKYHARSVASLLVLREDRTEYQAWGFTELLEALAMARPVVMTKSGALATQIDLEKEGCGLFVPPGDPHALACAMRQLAEDRSRAERMGQRARQLAESYYNLQRYAKDLHAFFEAL